MNLSWTRFLPGFVREKLEGRDSLQKAMGNTGWMMGDQIVRKAIGLLIGVLVARHFGPHLYGEFSYAVAVVMLVSPFARFGLEGIVIRDLARDSANQEKILGTSFFMMLVAGGLAFGLAVLGVLLLRPEGTLVQWMVGILTAGCIIQAFMAIEYWYESQMQWKYVVFSKTSAFIVISFSKVILLLVDAPLILFAWAGLAETVLGTFGLLLLYQKHGFSLKAWQFSKKLMCSLFHDSWPLILSAFFTMVYLRIDQIMVGSMVGSAELGKYSVAVQLSEVWIFIPMAIISAVFPAFVEVEKDNEKLFNAHLQKLFRILVVYAYLIAIPISIFAKDIILFFFSSSYSDAGPLVAVMVWGIVFSSLGTARHVLVVVKNWTRINLISVAMGGGLNIFLNLALIPTYGALGAAIATLVSYWFAVHGTCFFFQALRPTGWVMLKAMFFPKVW